MLSLRNNLSLVESLAEATRALEHNTLAHTHALYISRTVHQAHEP